MEYSPVLSKNQIHSPTDYTGEFPVVVMPKLDGYRCGITRPKEPNVEYKEGKYDVPNRVVGWSRNGKNIRSLFVQHILDKFYSVCGPGWDGELIAGNNFQEAAVVTQKGSIDESFNFTFVIFDYIPGYNLPYMSRLKIIQKAVVKFKEEYPSFAEYFLVVPYVLAYGYDDLQEQYEFMRTEEGCMLRVINNKGDSGYREGKRDPNLIKLKPFQQDEARIISFEEERYGKNLKTVPEDLWDTPKFRAGALIVQGLPGTKFEGKEWKIGSGLTHELRYDIFNNFQAHWYNKILTFKYLESGTKNKPRHPVYLGIREDYINDTV